MSKKSESGARCSNQGSDARAGLPCGGIGSVLTYRNQDSYTDLHWAAADLPEADSSGCYFGAKANARQNFHTTGVEDGD